MKHRRDQISGQITLDYLVERAAEGWKMSAIEWVKEDNASAQRVDEAAIANLSTSVPYGLQLEDESLRLQENPLEMKVLLSILDQIVKEKRVTQIAEILNQQGFQTRDGSSWNAASVFNLMPRLIEVGPDILRSAQWRELKAHPPTSVQ